MAQLRCHKSLVVVIGLIAAATGAVQSSGQQAPSGDTEVATGIDSLVHNIRDAYVDQFRTFAEERNGAGMGATEVKVQLHRSDHLFRKLICVDFLRITDDGHEPELFRPERQLQFASFETRIGGVSVAISSFGWDGVEIRYDSPKPVEEILGGWFEHWFDPEDERLDPEALLNGNIHNIVVVEGGVSVDLGTAPPEAFSSLIAAFEQAGISRLRVGSEI